MNSQQQYRKEPVPLGPSQDLETLLPGKHNSTRNSCSLRRTITPLIVVAILAGLSLFHKSHFQQTITAIKTSSTISETGLEVVEVTTTSTAATNGALTTIATTNTIIATSTTDPAQTGTQATPPSEQDSKDTETGIEGRKFTSYQVSWGAFHPCLFPYCMARTSATSGCLLGAGPSIRIYCGPNGKLDYIPQSNCLLDDHESMTTGSHSSSLYCQGTWNLVDVAHVTCSGMDDKALQIDVQVDGHTYRCNQVLNEHSTWNGIVQEKGGAVVQQVSVATRSNGGKWSEITTQSRTAGCSTGTAQCLDTYVSCQGADSCEATVPYLVASADLANVAKAAEASTGVQGDACTNNYTCQSGHCDNGVCQEE